MKTILSIAAAGALVMSGAASAQEKWYPSKYGRDDQAGRSNLMTPERAKNAMKYIKLGKVVSLARTYSAKMPLFGHRVFATRGTGGLAGGPLGDNKVIWMDDTLTAEIGQVGTQLDGLGEGGATAIYTQPEGPFHVISRIYLRMVSLSFFLPF